MTSDLAPITSDADLVRDSDSDLLREWNSALSARSTTEYLKDLKLCAIHHGSSTVAAFLHDFLGNGAAHGSRVAMAWKGAMLKQGLAPATVNRRLATLRSLVKFAQVTGKVEWSLAVRGVKRESPDPDPVPWSEFLVMLDKEPTARVRACLALMGYAGMRIQEIVSLELDDFNAAANKVKALRKGDRQKSSITLAPIVTQYVAAWVAERGDAPGSLFRFESPSWLRRLVAAAGTRAGVVKARPHRLRASMATRAAEETDSPYAVQAMLGHKDIQTAMHYVRIAQDLQGKTARLIAES